MATTSTKRRHEKNAELLADFPYLEGALVVVRRANGGTLHTVTLSRAFLLDGAYAMVRVVGIPGNTRLARVTHQSKTVPTSRHHIVASSAALTHYVDVWAEQCACGEAMFNEDGSGRGMNLSVALSLKQWAEAVEGGAPLCPACAVIVARHTGDAEKAQGVA